MVFHIDNIQERRHEKMRETEKSYLREEDIGRNIEKIMSLI